MDLSQLRAFVEVARTGNLTRASQTLALSQPALSSRIRQLEGEIGVQLFERSARGMTLTLPGSELYREACQTLEAARGFVSRARAITTPLSGRVRLGTISEPLALRLGEFLSTMVSECPEVVVSLTQAISGVVIERLLERELDAGYVIGDMHDAHIHCLPLMPVELNVVAPRDWAARLAGAGWAELGELPWVGTPQQCSYSSIMQNLFAQRGIAPRMVAEADHDNMLRNLVARGLGVSLLREDLAQFGAASGDLWIWPVEAVTTTLSFVQRADEMDTPLGATLREKVQRVWTKTPEEALV